MVNRRRALTAVSAAVLAITVSGSAFAAPRELTIGALLELTGPLSETGPAMEKATKLAVDAANAAAKQAGVAMSAKMVSADSQGDPQAALSAARTLVDQGASCLVGPVTTPESIAVLNGVTMQKKITLWPTATSTRLRTVNDQGTIFRTVPADSLQALALVGAIKDALGAAAGKTVAVAYRNEPYGEGLAKGFAKAWQAAGGQVGEPISFDPQQASFDSEAGQIVANTPDAYVVIDYPETYAKLGSALVRTGKFDPNKLFVPDAMSFANVPENMPAEAINGARGVSAGAPTGTEAYKLFNQTWDEAGGVENTALTANQFDAATLCFLSAVAAQSSEPGAIRDKVRSVTAEGAQQYTLINLADAVKAADAGQKIDYVGVSGALRFADNGDPTTSLYDIFQYQDGKRVIVKQIDVK